MSTSAEINDSANIIELPPLVFKSSRYEGDIYHVLNNGGLRTIISRTEVAISPRITEVVCQLNDGIKVIITEKKKINAPDNIDGILRKLGDNKFQWIFNKDLEKFSKSVDQDGLAEISNKISKSWKGQYSFNIEERDRQGNIINAGLRPPQMGGLHAIGSHWSLSNQVATVVMPTGTGKTETMLAALAAYTPGKILVIVPSKILRLQTAQKFLYFGLLRVLNNLYPDTLNPIVGILDKRPKTEENIKIFKDCNVVVSTMSALNIDDESLLEKIIENIDTLIVDEAHHIAANTWLSFRENFKDKKILQFTATPYRNDGKLVDGKVIFEYSLSAAQRDGYFKKINFNPVYEIDPEEADKAIAKLAVEKLREDLANGKNHIMMARCASIERAQKIIAIYQNIANDLRPVLVHSEESDSYLNIEQVKSGERKIVVCVNMLGEGFDLPQLKVAALHDTHKSLAVLLQFTGRFTRSAGDLIGDATVVANIADQDVSNGLEKLYSEDPDWNELLSEFSSEAAKSHTRLIEFLNESQNIGEDETEEKIEISHHLLKPTFSTLFYKADKFEPKKFFEGIPNSLHVHRVWLHNESNTLYFVTRHEPYIRWTRSDKIKDRVWSLYVIHYDDEQKILYLISSDKSSDHEQIAKAVGASNKIFGDAIFRVLGGINRLIFQNVGVKKHGRRNLSFAMYTGSDVALALSISERAGSVKSNLSGTGWERGKNISIGCSYKGRVWTREPGSIPELIQWCKEVGSKVIDDTIDTTKIIENVLIPEEINSLPDKQYLNIDWPYELLKESEDRIIISSGELSFPISLLDIEIIKYDLITSSVDFCLKHDDENWVNLSLTVGGIDGYTFNNLQDIEVSISIGRFTKPLTEFFTNYPPLIRFVDLSELDGNLLIKPQNPQDLKIPDDRFEAWDWTGININFESIWKDGVERRNSIQWRAAQQFINANYDIVFNDDSSGEAADLVCFKEEEDSIKLVLIHCKFTKGNTAGERVKDVVEVSSQAVRSAKWKWKFKDLCRHILDREKRLTESIGTRFMKGNKTDVNRFIKLSRFKEIKPEILIVQPGLSKERRTPDQTMVLASAFSYLKETIGVDLDVICSE